MKKLTSVAVVTTAEGERVSYAYTELDSDGNITSQNNRASFVALDEDLLAAIKTLKDAVIALPVEIGMSLDEVSRIEFVFKQKSCKGFPAIKTNVWPDDCTRQEGQNIILIPWTRAETYKFMGGETLYMDTRITLRDSTDQPQTEILALKMSPTLFQEADGS